MFIRCLSKILFLLFSDKKKKKKRKKAKDSDNEGEGEDGGEGEGQGDDSERQQPEETSVDDVEENLPEQDYYDNEVGVLVAVLVAV